MEQTESISWLENIVARNEGYEWQAVEQFSSRLIRLAESRLPSFLRGRVDPDDVVQSAFRSFFSRNEAGSFTFNEAADVWRLLAAITYRKVQRTIRYHCQQQRDARRETSAAQGMSPTENDSPTASSLLVMFETLGEILDRLPDTHKQILKLRLEGNSIEEIATQLSVSTRTVDRSIALARKVASEYVDAT